jgi:hypothetical protein
MKTLSSSLVCLGFLFAAPLQALSPVPEPKPAIPIDEAIRLATRHAATRIDLKDYYADRAWVSRSDTGPFWIVSFSPDGLEKKNGWFFVTIDMQGKASEPQGGVAWLSPLSLDKTPNPTQMAAQALREAAEKARQAAPPKGE